MAVRSGPSPKSVVKSLDDLGNLFKQPLTSGSTMNTNQNNTSGHSAHTPPAVPASEAPSQQSMGNVAAALQDTGPGLEALQQLLQGLDKVRGDIMESAAAAQGKSEAAVEAVDKLRAEYESNRAAETIAAAARDAENEKLKQTLKDMQAAAAKKPSLVSRVVNFNTLGSVAGLLAFGFVAAKEYKERTADTAEV